MTGDRDMTRVEFKKLVKDFARLEGQATIAVGTTGFAGDGDRLFLEIDGKGILFAHDDAFAFLSAAARAAETLGIGNTLRTERSN
jgi:hypothetical protein